MIKVCRMGHATFETPDLDKAIEHYTQVIGLSVVSRDAKRAHLATRLGHLAIELQHGSERRCTKLSFELAPEVDIADAPKELQKLGIASEQRTDTNPGLPKVVTFKDPKGTTIELFRDWQAVGNRGGPIAGVGALKLGHLAFSVHDPKAMSEFYAKVLGFKVSDWIGDFFVFMRCNSDHHVVNFITAKNVNMHHIAWEMKDSSQFNNACDVFGARKIPLVWGPARLGPGHNIAAFHRDHDDWVVEIYAELDQMKSEELGYWDPRPWHREMPQRPKVWPREEGWVWGLPPVPEFFRGRD